MSKLKSLKDFKEEGLLLSKEQQLSLSGSLGEPVSEDSSENWFYRDTMESSGADCQRCCRTDMLGYWTMDVHRCVYV